MIKTEYKKQVLQENCNEINRQTNFDKMSLYEYATTQADNDPDFFRWLFDDGEISDFGINLTDEQQQEYTNFINSL